MSGIISIFQRFLFMFVWLSLEDITSFLTLLSQTKSPILDIQKDIQKCLLGQYFEASIYSLQSKINEVKRVTKLFNMLLHMCLGNFSIKDAFLKIKPKFSEVFDEFGFYTEKGIWAVSTLTIRNNSLRNAVMFEETYMGSGAQVSVGGGMQVSAEGGAQVSAGGGMQASSEFGPFGPSKQYGKFTVFMNLFLEGMLNINKKRQDLIEEFLKRYGDWRTYEQTTQLDIEQFRDLCVRMRDFEYIFNIMSITLSESQNCKILQAVRCNRLVRNSYASFNCYSPLCSSPYPYKDIFTTFCAINSLIIWKNVERFNEFHIDDSLTLEEYMTISDADRDSLLDLARKISNAVIQREKLNHVRLVNVSPEDGNVYGIDFLNFSSSPCLFKFRGSPPTENLRETFKKVDFIISLHDRYLKIKPFLTLCEGISPEEIQSGPFLEHNGLTATIYCLHLRKIFEKYCRENGEYLPTCCRVFLTRELNHDEKLSLGLKVASIYKRSSYIMKGLKTMNSGITALFNMYPSNDYRLICEIIEEIIWDCPFPI